MFEDPDTSETAKTPAVDTEKADLADLDRADDTDSAASGPKHRKPSTAGETVKQVRDSINATVTKLTDSITKKPRSAVSGTTDSGQD